MSEKVRTNIALILHTGSEAEKIGDNFLVTNRLRMVHTVQSGDNLTTEELKKILGCELCMVFRNRVDLNKYPTTAVIMKGEAGRRPVLTGINCVLLSSESPAGELIPCQEHSGSWTVEIPVRSRFKEPDNHLM